MKIRLITALLLSMAFASSAFAESYIYLTNSTTEALTLNTVQTGHDNITHGDEWEQLAHSVPPMGTVKFLRFNRDQGIKWGKKYWFTTTVQGQSSTAVLQQKLKGTWIKYETEQKQRKIINARELWFKILDAQMETGVPYLLYKDSANSKSNQKNLGTIKSSNLCCEIIEYSDSNETAVCNLASIALPSFVILVLAFFYLHKIYAHQPNPKTNTEAMLSSRFFFFFYYPKLLYHNH